MSIQSRMEVKLKQHFAPERLEVVNESHLNAGHLHTGPGIHGTFDGQGETHFRIRIVAPAFTGLNRVDRHRAINDVLAEELADSVHALALEPAAPGEKTRW